VKTPISVKSVILAFLLSFMKLSRVFDFKQVSLLLCDVLMKIPGVDNHHVLAEFTAYKAMAGDFPSETAHSVSFWHASSGRFPLLSRLALRYLSVPTNSVNVESNISPYALCSQKPNLLYKISQLKLKPV